MFLESNGIEMVAFPSSREIFVSSTYADTSIALFEPILADWAAVSEDADVRLISTLALASDRVFRTSLSKDTVPLEF